MKEIMYNELAKEALSQLAKGAFLCVSDGQKDNIMTIGWGSLSYIWSKPIWMIMVRESRYTYQIIENTDYFSLSIPINVDLKKELAYCGTKSGRDYDKWKETNLTKVKANRVSTYLVDECDLHYECKIVAKTPLLNDNMNSDLVNKFYSNQDYHMLYFGEIVGTYVK